jgi:UDP-galactopyranose mutase
MCSPVLKYLVDQTASVVNYPAAEVGFTRIVEYKHLLHQVLPSVVKIVLKDSMKQLICLGSN